MLHEETVEAGTLALIRKLSSDKELANFTLVGGTALALQIGHRKSIDIDLFARRPFHSMGVGEYLRNSFDPRNLTTIENGVLGIIDGVKTTLIAHQYDWIRRPREIEGIRMASLDDIAAMKLHAVVRSGQRLKDFVDVHYLLEHRSMQEMTDAYLSKYPGMNAAVARNALLYHKDVNFDAPLELKDRGLKFEAVRERLVAAMLEPKRVFNGREVKEVRKGEEVKKEEDLGKGLGR